MEQILGLRPAGWPRYRRAECRHPHL